MTRVSRVGILTVLLTVKEHHFIFSLLFTSLQKQRALFIFFFFYTSAALFLSDKREENGDNVSYRTDKLQNRKISMAFCSLSTFLPMNTSSVSLTRSSSSLTTLRVANVRTVRFSTSAAATPKPATTTPTGKREPRGITKPRPISPAMQELLGVTEIPRTQALKQIWAYIKQHNLQDPENKKIIVCDEKLKKIFAGKERVGFLEISGLLNPHFIK